MIYGMDRDYAKCCKDYIKQWLLECDTEYDVSEEVMEYIIVKGGDGLRELELCFHKIIDTAQEYRVEKIDRDFIDRVFS